VGTSTRIRAGIGGRNRSGTAKHSSRHEFGGGFSWHGRRRPRERSPVGPGPAWPSSGPAPVRPVNRPSDRTARRGRGRCSRSTPGELLAITGVVDAPSAVEDTPQTIRSPASGGRATDRPTETRRGILSASRRHGKRPLSDDTRSPSVERPSGSVLTGARRRRDRPPDVYDGPGRCADDGWSCLPTVHSRGGGHGAGRRRSVEPSRPATPLVRTTPLQSGVFDPRQVSADVDVVPSPPRRPGIPVSESDDRVRCPRTVRTDRSLYTIFYTHTWRVAIRVDSAL